MTLPGERSGSAQRIAAAGSAGGAGSSRRGAAALGGRRPGTGQEPLGQGLDPAAAPGARLRNESF